MKRAILLLLLALARSAPASDEVVRLAAFLETNGVMADPAHALEGAVEGLLKAVDPEARFCSAADLEMLSAEGLTVAAGTAATGSVASVEALELWPEDLAYIKVSGLRHGGGEEILAHLRTLAAQCGIIVDLRGANGHDLPSAIGLAAPFRCAGDALLTVRDNSGKVRATYTAPDTAAIKAPLMVLTDRGTRDAAEILAALWRGCPGIMLIGTPTRGDSRIREVLTVPDGRRLLVATGRVVPAHGDSYDGAGVQPDIVVAAANGEAMHFRETGRAGRPLSDKSRQNQDLMARVDADAVLRRATDILLGLRALSVHAPR